ncbi:hypothetical protein PR048_024779 [Dryococelus australis]|uniref:Uncharacterized protein n=1 Tax=Dryococelus australis TaxID=614101 RepID=A0ABQ9GPJ0_9NEOP|nr:hypothetical protein PR048_024779 [Dryococelus australis]
MGHKKEGLVVDCLAFANNTALIAKSLEVATLQVNCLRRQAAKVGLQMSLEKTQFFTHIKEANREMSLEQVIRPEALYVMECLSLNRRSPTEKLEVRERRILRKILGPIWEDGEFLRQHYSELYQYIERLSDCARKQRAAFYDHPTGMGVRLCEPDVAVNMAGPHRGRGEVEDRRADLLVLVGEQADEYVDGAQVVEAAHVVGADGALPDGASDGGEQGLVLQHGVLLGEAYQRVQAPALPHQHPRLLVLSALHTTLSLADLVSIEQHRNESTVETGDTRENQPTSTASSATPPRESNPVRLERRKLVLIFFCREENVDRPGPGTLWTIFSLHMYSDSTLGCTVFLQLHVVGGEMPHKIRYHALGPDPKLVLTLKKFTATYVRRSYDKGLQWAPNHLLPTRGSDIELCRKVDSNYSSVYNSPDFVEREIFGQGLSCRACDGHCRDEVSSECSRFLPSIHTVASTPMYHIVFWLAENGSSIQCMFVSFDIRGIVHRGFISSGLTANDEFYCQVLRRSTTTINTVIELSVRVSFSPETTWSINVMKARRVKSGRDGRQVRVTSEAHCCIVAMMGTTTSRCTDLMSEASSRMTPERFMASLLRADCDSDQSALAPALATSTCGRSSGGSSSMGVASAARRTSSRSTCRTQRPSHTGKDWEGIPPWSDFGKPWKTKIRMVEPGIEPGSSLICTGDSRANVEDMRRTRKFVYLIFGLWPVSTMELVTTRRDIRLPIMSGTRKRLINRLVGIERLDAAAHILAKLTHFTCTATEPHSVASSTADQPADVVLLGMRVPCVSTDQYCGETHQLGYAAELPDILPGLAHACHIGDGLRSEDLQVPRRQRQDVHQQRHAAQVRDAAPDVRVVRDLTQHGQRAELQASTSTMQTKLN